MKIINIFSLAFSSQEFKTRLIFIMIYLTIITLLIDTSVDQIYYLNINEYPLNVKVILFMIIAVIALIGQYAFLHFVGKKGIDIRKTDILNIGTLLKIAHVVQSVLTILFLIVIFQMIFEI
jgi:Tfp pilus assembly protein PilO